MRCPICKREFERESSPAVPFCSERCRTIDLGRWLGESYSLPVIPDPEAAGKRWGEKHYAIQLNHLVVVKNTVSEKAADEVYDILVESKKAAGNPAMLPHGLDANRRNLEVAIDVAYKGKLIARRFTVEELMQ